jgi:putative transposase
VQLRYSFRLYPSPGQAQALARAFGCARLVFNDALAIRQAAHEAGQPYLSDADMSARLTAWKKTPERAWLGEVSAVVLQQALADLNAAYRNFFDSVTGKRKGPKVGLPRFRSRKDSRQSVRFTRNSRFAVLSNGKLRLPKIGDVRVRWSRALPAAPASSARLAGSSRPARCAVRAGSRTAPSRCTSGAGGARRAARSMTGT